MSTRCQIAVYENENDPVHAAEVFLYRHSDGYPDGECGVVSQILPFLKAFKAARGINDTSYCLARLTGHLTQLHPGTLGYGLDGEIHGDIEYFYHVSPAALQVYKVMYGEDYKLAGYKKWIVVQNHPITKEKTK